jgi:hypothetical protein
MLDGHVTQARSSGSDLLKTRTPHPIHDYILEGVSSKLLDGANIRLEHPVDVYPAAQRQYQRDPKSIRLNAALLTLKHLNKVPTESSAPASGANFGVTSHWAPLYCAIPKPPTLVACANYLLLFSTELDRIQTRLKF